LRRRLSRFYAKAAQNVKRSLRTQLILTFLVCLGIAAGIGTVTTGFLEKTFATRRAEYSSGVQQLDIQTQHMAEEIEIISQRFPGDAARRTSEIQLLLNNRERNTPDQDAFFRIIDETGTVVMKSLNADGDPVNVTDLLRTALEQRALQRAAPSELAGEYVTVYPVLFEGRNAYLVCNGVPRVRVYSSQDFSLIGMIAFVTSFLFLFYQITKRKTGYIEELARDLRVISEGKLGHRVRQKGEDELGDLAKSINHMAEELEKKIEEERRAERLKTELITSVSHDLRTPLTSIIGYLRLLYDGKAQTHKEQREYLRIAFSKSEQLQRLVEDLFEYTKLSHHDVQLNKQAISLNEMLEQIAEEFIPFMEESGLTLHKTLPEEELIADVDAEKLVRVFENLFGNALKYSHKPSRVEVRLQKRGGGAEIALQNKGDEIPEEQLARLFERFYRAEQSRSVKGGGSGLGLAIAKSIVELHGGRIWATSKADTVTFSVWLPLTK
jgi:signal transduction histidine kinase